MKFLYLGKNTERADRLETALSRSKITILRAQMPEAAFFRILQDHVEAVFVDFAEEDPGFDPLEAVENLGSLDKELEIVLIGSVGQVNALGSEKLRGCFGYLSPDLDEPINTMVLHQLTYKISLHARMASLKNSAIVDGLTQLYNHGYIQTQLEEEIQLLTENEEDLSLVILDIDNFKHYNDTNGHPAGDEVLRKIAGLLDKSVRKIDYAVRYGGEEFMMVLPGANLWTCLQIAERVRKTICHSEFPHGHKQPLGFVSASFGAAMLDGDMIKDKATLIQVADNALYRAKRGDKNCVWYYQNGDYHQYIPAGKLGDD